MNTTIPAVLMRGGTSKGVFLHARDLPPEGPARDRVILDLMGSPDPMQIDGLGGTYSSTSKVVVVAPGEGDHDVKYWFAQIGVDTPVVDWSGNCGNLTTAVGPFAIDEGLAPAIAPKTILRLLNVNTGVRIRAAVPVEDGRARTEGDHAVAGVPGTGAPIETHYLDPGGGVLGSVLPTGSPVDRVTTPDGEFDVSILDITHPYAFVELTAVGLGRGSLTTNGLDLLERLRATCAVLVGRSRSEREATSESPTVPRLAFVDRPEDATGDIRLIAISMGKLHHAAPMTAALCCAAATQIAGTIPYRVSRRVSGAVRVAHPKGVTEVLVDPGPQPTRSIRSVGVVRTARRLFAGDAFLHGSTSGPRA